MKIAWKQWLSKCNTYTTEWPMYTSVINLAYKLLIGSDHPNSKRRQPAAEACVKLKSTKHCQLCRGCVCSCSLNMILNKQNTVCICHNFIDFRHHRSIVLKMHSVYFKQQNCHRHWLMLPCRASDIGMKPWIGRSLMYTWAEPNNVNKMSMWTLHPHHSDWCHLPETVNQKQHKVV